MIVMQSSKVFSNTSRRSRLNGEVKKLAAMWTVNHKPAATACVIRPSVKKIEITLNTIFLQWAPNDIARQTAAATARLPLDNNHTHLVTTTSSQYQ